MTRLSKPVATIETLKRLVSNSDNKYATKDSLSTVATTGNYSDLKGTPTSLPANGGNASTVNGHTVLSNVPANAKFTDTVYIHPSTHPASMITGLSTVATSGSYNDLSNKPTIPTTLPANGGNSTTVNNHTVNSDVPANAKFTDTVYTHPNSGVTAGTYKSVTVNAQGHVTGGTNPTTLSGYGITDAKIVNGVITLGSNTITPLTYHQSLANYYTKSEVNSQISSIPKFAIAVVTDLPTSNISNTTIYLKKTGDDTQNLYTEYIYVNSKWEQLGTQKLDLSGYLTKTDASNTYLGKTAAAASANKLTVNAGSATSPIYFTNGIPTACTGLSAATVTATTTLNIPGGKIWIE